MSLSHAKKKQTEQLFCVYQVLTCPFKTCFHDKEVWWNVLFLSRFRWMKNLESIEWINLEQFEDLLRLPSCLQIVWIVLNELGLEICSRSVWGPGVELDWFLKLIGLPKVDLSLTPVMITCQFVHKQLKEFPDWYSANLSFHAFQSSRQSIAEAFSHLGPKIQHNLITSSPGDSLPLLSKPCYHGLLDSPRIDILCKGSSYSTVIE